MTVAISDSRWVYDGDTTTKSFQYTSKIFADTDLKVYVDDVLQTLTTDYTVTGAGSDDGGNVVFVAAPGTGTDNIVILRDVTDNQPTKFAEGARFPASAVQAALDRRAIVSQQQGEEIARALKLAETSTFSPPLVFPDPDGSGAIKVIGWNAAGTALAVYAFSDLSAALDVALSGLASDDILVWDGAQWVNAAPATVRAALSLEPGTDIQTYSATLAALAGLSLAQGDILYRDGSALQRLAAGTAGQLLQTGGAGANPSWVNARGVIQYKRVHLIEHARTTNASWAKPTGWDLEITPTNASSYLVMRAHATINFVATPGQCTASIGISDDGSTVNSSGTDYNADGGMYTVNQERRGHVAASDMRQAAGTSPETISLLVETNTGTVGGKTVTWSDVMLEVMEIDGNAASLETN